MVKDYVLWMWLGPTSSDESLGKRLSKNVTKTNPQEVSNMSKECRRILNIDPNDINTRMVLRFTFGDLTFHFHKNASEQL